MNTDLFHKIGTVFPCLTYFMFLFLQKNVLRVMCKGDFSC